eukprot:689210-Prymnesium_polylepis.1
MTLHTKLAIAFRRPAASSMPSSTTTSARISSAIANIACQSRGSFANSRSKYSSSTPSSSASS